MTSTERTILLREPELPDSEEVLAMRYMHRHLDQALEDWEGERFTGPPPDDLAGLLRLRFGAMTDAFDRKPGERLSSAAERAIAQTYRPAFENEGGAVYVTAWDPESACAWFQKRLDTLWPKEAPYSFLAADVVTLRAACVAMDLAPKRKQLVADDPFPAPPLLIRGPTGVGKELLAVSVHLRSGEQRTTLGAINCGGLSPELLESELFGHVRGAFTGATRNKKGFVEEYPTVFLDEVGDMPPAIQVRLLRFLNTGEYRPVGHNKLLRHTPRIISATLKDPKTGLREDLYFRLRGRALELRGLAHRQESILPLFIEFLRREALNHKRKAPFLTHEAAAALYVYPWPGNMREMKYAVEYVLDACAPNRVVVLDDLPDDIRRSYQQQPAVDRTALALKAAEQEGEATSKRKLRAAYAIHRHLTEHRSARADTITRFAKIIERLGALAGLEEYVAPHAARLRIVAKLQRIKEAQTQWLDPLNKVANSVNLEVADVLHTMEQRISEEQALLDAECSALDLQTERASAKFAAAAVLAMIVPALHEGSQHVVQAEQLVAMLEWNPLARGVRWIGNWLKERSAEELRDWFKKNFTESEDEELDLPSWESIREDPAKIRAIMNEHFEGKQVRMAEAYNLRSETISRALKTRGTTKASSGVENHSSSGEAVESTDGNGAERVGERTANPKQN